MSNASTNDAFFDSDELMSWLLLNPEVGDFDASQQGQGGVFPDLLDDVPVTDDISGFPVKVEPVQDFANLPFGGSTVADTDSLAASTGSKRATKSAKPRTNATAGKQAAKVGKKRQRESVEDIEARVNELRSENADLQAHLMNVTQRTTEVQKQRLAMEKLMITKLAELGDRDDADQTELAQIVKQYTDIYADYGKCRQREVRLRCDSDRLRSYFSFITPSFIGCFPLEPIGEVIVSHQDHEVVVMGAAAG
jgi:hypothetical protein